MKCDCGFIYLFLFHTVREWQMQTSRALTSGSLRGWYRDASRTFHDAPPPRRHHTWKRRDRCDHGYRKIFNRGCDRPRFRFGLFNRSFVPPPPSSTDGRRNALGRHCSSLYAPSGRFLSRRRRSRAVYTLNAPLRRVVPSFFFRTAAASCRLRYPRRVVSSSYHRINETIFN